MIVTPEFVLVTALGVAISGYSVFNLIFERNFVERYRKFRASFEEWRRKEISGFYKEFQKMIKKLDTAKTFEFIDKWVERQRIINELPNEHNKIRKHIIWSLASLLASALLAIMVLNDPLGKIGDYLYGDIGLGFLALGIIIIFWCIYDYYRISTRIMSHELGAPIEKVVEDFIKESKSE